MSAGLSDWSFFVEHRGEILGATVDHLALVVIAMLIAIVIAVPLGMFVVQRPALRAIALGMANIFQPFRAWRFLGC
jgi:osmoprotectant transport system permease protein